MMGHVRKAIMKLTFVIIVIAVTFITVSCSSQKKGTAYSVYFLNEDGTSLTGYTSKVRMLFQLQMNSLKK